VKSSDPLHKKLSRVVRSTIDGIAEHEIPVRSAALAYYGLLSIFPLLLFLVFLGSQFLESAESRTALNDGLEELIPAASEIVQQVVDQTIEARGSIGLIAGIGLLWSASTLFNALTTSLNAIWGATPRPFWRRRVVAAVSVLSIGVLFMLSVIISAMTVISLPGEGTVIGQGFNFSLGLIVTTLLFWLVYHGIPNIRVHPLGTLGASLLAAILWQLAKSVFALYLASGLTNYGAVYGSLASVIALVIWAYISSLIVFLGAVFGAALEREFWGN
jgi:membrane protein